jgi:23S rRNA pseudouridine2605 synthase
VRRMLKAVGHPVDTLVRTRIGPLSDHALKPGRWRDLTPAEVAALERHATRPAAASPARSSPGPGPRTPGRTRRPAPPRRPR